MKWSVYNTHKQFIEFDATLEADNLRDLLDFLASYDQQETGCYAVCTLKWHNEGYGWLPYEYTVTRTGLNSWHVYDCQWCKEYTVEL